VIRFTKYKHVTDMKPGFISENDVHRFPLK